MGAADATAQSTLTADALHEGSDFFGRTDRIESLERFKEASRIMPDDGLDRIDEFGLQIGPLHGFFQTAKRGRNFARPLPTRVVLDPNASRPAGNIRIGLNLHPGSERAPARVGKPLLRELSKRGAPALQSQGHAIRQAESRLENRTRRSVAGNHRRQRMDGERDALGLAAFERVPHLQTRFVSGMGQLATRIGLEGIFSGEPGGRGDSPGAARALE